MIVNEASISALFTGFKAFYSRGLDAAETHYDKIAMIAPSSARSESYGWLGQFPQLREWLDGDRVVKDLKAHGFTIENRKFESTISIRREDIADDRVGVFGTQFSEMGHRARQHPDELIFDLLAKGFETTCYDGQYFFDTDHPTVAADGMATTVSNMQAGTNAPWFLMDASRVVKPLIWQEREGYQLQAVNNPNDFKVFMSDIYHFGIRARVNAGFGLWQLAFGSKAELTPDNYAAARAAMMKLRGDQGRILGIKPTVLVVGPELEEMGHRIVNSENSTGGDTNPWKDSASLIVSPIWALDPPERTSGALSMPRQIGAGSFSKGLGAARPHCSSILAAFFRFVHGVRTGADGQLVGCCPPHLERNRYATSQAIHRRRARRLFQVAAYAELATRPTKGDQTAAQQVSAQIGKAGHIPPVTRGVRMNENIRVKIRDAYAQIKASKAMFEEGLKALSNALETVGACEDHLLQHGLDNLPECNVPVTEHRKEHRMGRVPKIDADPELQAFLIARIDRLTYAQIAREVADHFPEPRRVGKSAIHAWVKKRRRG